jgi:uncharacterized protein (DUF362 family)
MKSDPHVSTEGVEVTGVPSGLGVGAARVAVGTTTPKYNNLPPFHPGERFAELGFSETSSEPNPAYALLRRLWLKLGLDRAGAETSRWDPLGDFIQPGDTVLIKPNFVGARNASGGDLFAVVTHPSMIRAVVDYTYVALKGRGRIVIADAPEMNCQWDRLMEAQRLESVQAFYRDRFQFDVEVRDLRDFALRDPDAPAYSSNRITLPGDPAGSTIINLGRRSAFYGLPSANYYGADYDRNETIRHHHDEVHEYSISNTFLRADVVLSVPKMKVHKKVGVTLNLKGLVGVNTNKNYLIHYRLGSPGRNGDQLPDHLPGSDTLPIRIQRWMFDHALARQSRVGDAAYAACRGLYRLVVKPFRTVSQETLALDGGNWHGNDSAWRMTADLARILFFADRQGVLQSSPQRRVFCVVDGIVAGEKAGPLAPTAKPCGCIVTGSNPIAVDLVTTRLMGFDPGKLRQFALAFKGPEGFGLRGFTDIEVIEERRTWAGTQFFSADRRDPGFAFEPHPGWKGHIEL